MSLLFSTINQMAFLMLLIGIGFFLSRKGIVPQKSTEVLSKLENNLFIPALMLSTFMKNFTVKSLSISAKFFITGLIVITITTPLAIILARVCAKDDYIRNIYTYGLAFSNFGFMGNAVVEALFPDIFMEYLIFVLPFYIFIYIWGVPYLLMPKLSGTHNIYATFRNLLNPMLIAMVVGMIIGLINLPLPSFVNSVITTLGSCMSPIAMLLTGMTIAKISLKRTFKNISIYIVSLIRLFIIPLSALGVLVLIKLPFGLALCTVCSLSMPLGLNSIVIPGAYGRDTTSAAGMALVSHLLSCISIPIIFTLFNLFFK